MKEFVKKHQSCYIRCQSTKFFTDFDLTVGRNFVTGSKPTTRSFSTVKKQILNENPKNFLGDFSWGSNIPPHLTFNIQAREEHEQKPIIYHEAAQNKTQAEVTLKTFITLEQYLRRLEKWK